MSKYAYVTLLYPNKYGKCTYLDGAILTALGLRKQNVKHEIICLITNDVDNQTKKILEILYDKIIEVKYISPLENYQIKIIPDIFSKKDYTNQNKYSEMCKIFTKLNIFNPNILPYDKIVFIDTDLIPLSNYDSLFELNTPAGWLEIIRELDEHSDELTYTRVWGIWKAIPHNTLIPKIFTDIYKKPGSSINGGLLVIKPDYEIYLRLINKLQTPKNEWFGNKHLHQGTIDTDGSYIDYYFCPEQEFLTQEFTGKWYMIDGSYCKWGNYDSDKNINGIHMAGLKYLINNKWINAKTWEIQILKDDGFNVISNLITIWGILKYPKLKDFLMQNLKIYDGKNLINLSDIIIHDDLYNKLLTSQKFLHKILSN